MTVIIETSRSGLCHMDSLFGVNPRIKEAIEGGRVVMTWHGCTCTQVRAGDPWTASAYAFTCSDKEQAKAFAREIPGFIVYEPSDCDGAYQTYEAR